MAYEHRKIIPEIMSYKPEYILCRQIACYLRSKYPNVIYHFDLAGLNLSKAQAGMMKGIQGKRGWPDLFIAEVKGKYHGLFIELKPEGTKLLKGNGDYATSHITEQANMIIALNRKGYYASFSCGYDNTIPLIDWYLNLQS